MNSLCFASIVVASLQASVSCSQSRPPTPASEHGQTEPSTAPDEVQPDPTPAPEPESTVVIDREVSDQACCPELSELIESPLREKFSVHGYAARTLAVEHEHAGSEQVQCVVVTWPKGSESNAGKPSRVAELIHEAWFVAIENTLRRVPAHHARTLRRVVIDNHPTRHGIAAFDREDAADGRDGHTIWLSQHLFLDPNHWERGIRGDYFAYHANVDGVAIHELPAQHDVYSPVLLHELGHLVMYHIVRPESDALSPPECARTCSDEGTCETISVEDRERPCISPYCRPFKYQASTENWAEQYRFFYQSSRTRELLALADRGTSNCFHVLASHDAEPAPWLRGLPDMSEFRPSRWDSCGGRACKAW